MREITKRNMPAAALAWSITAFVLLLLGNSAVAGTPISSARVWPAAEYTRLTLESGSPIQYSLSTVKNPDRVVIDLERVALTTELEKFPAKIDATDP
jgi:N-acetylmuramoyl-L-alanine amidase